jgi:hypothetical protein
MQLTIPVRDLRPGDILIASQQVVRSLPGGSLRTPAGKLDLLVERVGKPGSVREVRWGARTTVKIERPTEIDGYPAGYTEEQWYEERDRS